METLVKKISVTGRKANHYTG